MESENNTARQTREIQSLDIRAILLPGRGQEEVEEFEYDILYEEDRRIWSASLPNGRYLIVVKSPKFKEINEIVTVNVAKDNYFELMLQEKSKEVPQLVV